MLGRVCPGRPPPIPARKTPLRLGAVTALRISTSTREGPERAGGGEVFAAGACCRLTTYISFLQPRGTLANSEGVESTECMHSSSSS